MRPNRLWSRPERITRGLPPTHARRADRSYVQRGRHVSTTMPPFGGAALTREDDGYTWASRVIRRTECTAVCPTTVEPKGVLQTSDRKRPARITRELRGLKRPTSPSHRRSTGLRTRNAPQLRTCKQVRQEHTWASRVIRRTECIRRGPTTVQRKGVLLTSGRERPARVTRERRGLNVPVLLSRPIDRAADAQRSTIENV